MLEIKDICPQCGEEELRPVMLGNDKDGWQLTGDFECDNCDETFRPFNNSEELEVIARDDEPNIPPQYILDAKDDYTEYKDREVAELNSKWYGQRKNE